MLFRSREEAATRLAQRLSPYRGTNPLVLAIPVGAVPMGRIIADALHGALDVVLVRKLGAPLQPELAIGSIDEEGEVYLAKSYEHLRISPDYLESEKRHQREILAQRRAALSPGRTARNPTGRVVIVVDDGIATGSTMMAALRWLQRKRPKKVIIAVAVAPSESLRQFKSLADEVICLETPADFLSVGQFFTDFHQVSVAEGAALLQTPAPSHEQVVIPLEQVSLVGDLMLPTQPVGLVLFAHGSGSSRQSPRNRYVAEVLQQANIGSLLFDLLSPEEDTIYETRFNIALLTKRLVATTEWMIQQPTARGLPLGFFGASTGAAAALQGAALLGEKIAAVVSRGGRPDMAMAVLAHVRAPTLLLVGGRDEIVIDLNQKAFAALACAKELKIIPGATHLFEEPGALEEVARLAAQWFTQHLSAKK